MTELELILIILSGVLLAVLIATNIGRVIYLIRRRRKWLATHVRVIMFHKNHTVSSDWKEVDSNKSDDRLSQTIEYDSKSYIYDPECVYSLPRSFGMYKREPFIVLTENNLRPLDMKDILKKLKSEKTPEEFYEALHSKVFIDMMRGIAPQNTTKILLILGVVAVIAYFALKFMGGE